MLHTWRACAGFALSLHDVEAILDAHYLGRAAEPQAKKSNAIK